MEPIDRVREETDQEIPTKVVRWPRKWRFGLGILAFIPTALLAITVLVLLIGVAATHGAGWSGLVAMLAYTHVGAEFITLLVFGNLMIENPRLTTAARAWWVAGFLFLAPVAIPLYWWIHIIHSADDVEPFERPGQADVSPHVHVYDVDFTSDGPPDEVHVREDGSIIHQLHERPAT